jgi:hypothetical protein
MTANEIIDMMPNDIIEMVAHYRNVTAEEIRGKSQKRRIVNARQGAMWLTLEKCKGLTQQEIAPYFNRDRTMLCHSRDRVEDSLSINDGQFKWVKNQDWQSPIEDLILKKLVDANHYLDEGNMVKCRQVLKEAIYERQYFLASIESMKADQMLHEQTNQS